jgi:hypothetical protein
LIVNNVFLLQNFETWQKQFKKTKKCDFYGIFSIKEIKTSKGTTSRPMHFPGHHL